MNKSRRIGYFLFWWGFIGLLPFAAVEVVGAVGRMFCGWEYYVEIISLCPVCCCLIGLYLLRGKGEDEG